MTEQLVFIPCRLDRRDASSALIDDADGWPRKVVGPLGRVGGRLVVAARWLREANTRHRVRFGDGAELWVVQGPGRADDFVPLGCGPDQQCGDSGAAGVKSSASALALDVVVGPPG